VNILTAAAPRTFPYPRPLPEPTAEKLPRWRGFNLLYKFNVNAPPTPERVMEEDFRLIASLGFNYVRIPMDYRGWIIGRDWERLDEAKLREIDQIVGLGEKYGIHVTLNFHRAPGYTVAKPAEARDLWKDPEAQRVCALHWAAFARRYRGIPNARLSFNLFNEPSNLSEPVYFGVVQKMVEAIRAEDPARLILCDGLDYGTVAPRSLRTLGVALCTRGYRPMNISHYRASWVTGSETWAVPEWPAPQVSAYLYGNRKPEFHSPLVIEGALGGSTLHVRANVVSTLAKLRITDERGTVLWEHAFVPGPGEGEWKKSVLRPEWKSYQATYDRDYAVPLPAGITRMELRNVEGDWLTFSSLSIERAGRRWTLSPVDAWGQKQSGVITFDPARGQTALRASKNLDRAWLRDTCYDGWRQAAANGLGVMVGEFGAYRHTPHAVVLRWMDDLLATVSESGWGWALWEFRGGFGILDSKRNDVTYESWEGHELDRAMLELLQKY
jgi:aryl-phospho-beta-D-glucosidase BglC (GH1 family)